MHSRVYHGLCMNLENSAADHQQPIISRTAVRLGLSSRTAEVKFFGSSIALHPLYSGSREDYEQTSSECTGPTLKLFQLRISVLDNCDRCSLPLGLDHPEAPVDADTAVVRHSSCASTGVVGLLR